MPLSLIDTSAWTQALRRNGDPVIRSRVESLWAGGQTAWCDAVRLELWNGVRGEKERQKLTELEMLLPSLPINADVWRMSCELAAKARASGLNVPAVDLIICSCARHHSVAIEHADRHFELLLALN